MGGYKTISKGDYSRVYPIGRVCVVGGISRCNCRKGMEHFEVKANMTTFVETRKTFIVYPHLGIKEEVEEEVFVVVENKEEKEQEKNE